VKYYWATIDAETALYVDRGRETILCDRLPSPVTLVLKIKQGSIPEFVFPRHAESFEGYKSIKDSTMSQTEWMPIETAPKDGTYVLGYDPRAELAPLVQVYWAPDGFWTCRFGRTWMPTHWMPLPEPPK
jgi:hypothetical protein